MGIQIVDDLWNIIMTLIIDTRHLKKDLDLNYIEILVQWDIILITITIIIPIIIINLTNLTILTI